MDLMNSFAVMQDKSLKKVRVPIPEISPYQALVKMQACGVCNGTDIKLAHHKFKNFDTYPAILGHEGVGKVVKTGEKVCSLKEGDRVLLPFLEQPSGGFYSAWGAYSEYAVVGDRIAMEKDGLEFPESYYAQTIVPENIGSVEASMIVTLREVYSAIKRFSFNTNDKICIFGAGPVGLSFIKLLRLSGHSQIMSFDVKPEKLKEASEMGASYAFDSSKAVESVEKYFGKADAVIDAVGINSLVNLGMELISDHGKLCCYGISPELQMNLDWSKAPYNWSLNFVQWPSKYEEYTATKPIMKWIEEGSLNLNDFISHVFPFSEMEKAFDLIENRKTDKKIVIDFTA